MMEAVGRWGRERARKDPSGENVLDGVIWEFLFQRVSAAGNSLQNAAAGRQGSRLGQEGLN